eukprot:100079_1
MIIYIFAQSNSLHCVSNFTNKIWKKRGYIKLVVERRDGMKQVVGKKFYCNTMGKCLSTHTAIAQEDDHDLDIVAPVGTGTSTRQPDTMGEGEQMHYNQAENKAIADSIHTFMEGVPLKKAEDCRIDEVDPLDDYAIEDDRPTPCYELGFAITQSNTPQTEQNQNKTPEPTVNKPFVPHMSVEQANALRIGDTIDYRLESGKFVYAMVSEKRKCYLTLKHNDDKGMVVESQCDYTQHIYRFAQASTITQRECTDSDLMALQVNDNIEVNPIHTPHLGWKLGRIMRFDCHHMQKLQVQIEYEDENKTKHTYWTHLDNHNEVQILGTNIFDDICDDDGLETPYNNTGVIDDGGGVEDASNDISDAGFVQKQISYDTSDTPPDTDDDVVTGIDPVMDITKETSGGNTSTVALPCDSYHKELMTELSETPEQKEETPTHTDDDDEKVVLEPVHRTNKGDVTIQYKWQWDTGSSWKDYSVTDSQVMESQFGNIDTIQLQMGNSRYVIDFRKKVQRNISTKVQRDIRRVPIQSKRKSKWQRSHHKKKSHRRHNHKQPATRTNKSAYVWQFSNRDRMANDIKFYDYDDKQSAHLESKYRSCKNATFNIKVHGQTYSINLKAMTQSNRNTGRSRIIRRVLLDNDDDYKQPSFSPDTYHSAPATATHGKMFDMKPQSGSFNPHQTQKPTTTSVAHKWQWFGGNGFVDYKKKQCIDMELSYNGGMKQYRFKHDGTGYTVKFNQMKQYNDNLQTHRDIRRVPLTLQSPANKHGARQKWQWFDGKHFVDYSKKISIDIENAYRLNKRASRTFKASNNEANYNIDFKTLKQINTQTKTERAVRRVDMKTKSYKPQTQNRQRTKQGWPDPKYWKGPKATAKRKVFGKKIMTLYHVTDPDAADSIFSDHKMKRGARGMFGAGIYFAETVRDATYKAQHHGNLITAKVFVGREYTVHDGSAGQFTFRDLQSKGYDSVYAPRGSGNGNAERVIYNFDQVCVVSKKQIKI